MYRNKILVIFTVMICILLGVIIWSSNVVADHEAMKKKQQENVQQGTVIGVEIPEEQIKDFITEEPEEEAGAGDSGAGEQLVEGESGKKLVIDTQGLLPEITPRETVLRNLSANYLDKIDFSENLILWNTTTFPLKIYIKDEKNLPEGFVGAVKTAFRTWEQSLSSFITFDYTLEEAAANIVVSVPESPAEGCPGVNGIEYKFDLNGKTINKAELIVPQKDCNGENFDTANLYAQIQHPIGHILGINTHSSRAGDVMYQTPSYENINISSIDIETLKLLYYFVPDITNKPYTKKEAADLIKLTSLKGKAFSEIEEALLEKINSKHVATPYEISVDEAYKFYEDKDYDSAISKYLDASSQASNSIEKSFALRAVAILYLKMNRSQDAIRYANSLMDVSNIPYNQYIVAYINFESGNNDTALMRLEELIKDYPKLRAAYSIMAQIYSIKNDTEKLDSLIQLAKEQFGDRTPVYYQEAPQEE